MSVGGLNEDTRTRCEPSRTQRDRRAAYRGVVNVTTRRPCVPAGHFRCEAARDQVAGIAVRRPQPVRRADEQAQLSDAQSEYLRESVP